jgi:hypothetical protein
MKGVKYLEGMLGADILNKPGLTAAARTLCEILGS